MNPRTYNSGGLLESSDTLAEDPKLGLLAVGAIEQLGRIGSREDIPRLEQIRRMHPYQQEGMLPIGEREGRGNSPVPIFFARRAADEAMAAIEARESP